MNRDFVFYRNNYKCGLLQQGNLLFVIDFIPPIMLLQKYDVSYIEHNGMIYYPDNNNCVLLKNIERELIFSIYHIKNHSVVDFARYHFYIINISPPKRSTDLLRYIQENLEKRRKEQEKYILNAIYSSDEEDDEAEENECEKYRNITLVELKKDNGI